MGKYTVDSVVSDYGVFEDGNLKLICHSRPNALLIKDIMEKDDRFGQGFIQDPTYDGKDFSVFRDKYRYDI